MKNEWSKIISINLHFPDIDEHILFDFDQGDMHCRRDNDSNNKQDLSNRFSGRSFFKSDIFKDLHAKLINAPDDSSKIQSRK